MPPSKRPRTSPPSVEFVQPKDPQPHQPKDIVNRLNFSANDERRKLLLQRLRDIDQKKAQLQTTTPPTELPSPVPGKEAPSPAPSNDSVIFVDEKPTNRYPNSASPTDVQEVVIAVPPPRPASKRISRAKSRRRPPVPKKSPAAAVIDVDAVKPVPAKKPRAKKTQSRKVTDPAAPKRTSSRVRRPRTPKADTANAFQPNAVPTPTCMSKCKRYQFCKKLISSMIRNSSAGPFSAPVKELWAAEAIPRYFDVITNPMDLRTVKKKLENSAYIASSKGGVLPYFFRVEAFHVDVCLVFRNSMVYNRRGDMLYNCAQSLMEDFETTMQTQLPPIHTADYESTVGNKRPLQCKGRKEKTVSSPRSRSPQLDNDVVMTDAPSIAVASATAKVSRKESWTASASKKGVPEPSETVCETMEEMQDRILYLRRCRTAVLARTPLLRGTGYLSRAALLYSVDISYEQKLRCSSAIENGKVPGSKLEGLVALVKKSTGYEKSNGVADDEFEFEFDKLDNVAWRNMEAFLEQFVPGFKTIRSSVLGREFGSVEEVDRDIEALRTRLENREEDGSTEEAKKKPTVVTGKPRSFFGGDVADGESSSDSSDGESDSDSSDSDESDEE